MDDYKVLKDGRKVYSLDGIKSRQTGTNAEYVLIIGGKNIGKTFNIRLDLVQDYIDNGRRFVEISRSRDEMQDVAAGYFDKMVSEGYFPGYIFKTDSRTGYIARKPADDEAKPEWQVCCYFVATTLFQRAKRRANYVNVCNAIFDEFIIDKRDRWHRYAPGEFGLLMNMLDSIFRPFPNDGIRRNVYLMGNACDLTCPHLRYLGIDKPPKYGYTFYRNKSVLLHYVKPWDSEERKSGTIIGRLLDGADADMVFENRFDTGDEFDIEAKSSKARYAFGLAFEDVRIGIWDDLDGCTFYVTSKIPKDNHNVYALTKRNGTIDYTVIAKSENLLKMLVKVFYARGLRYESVGIREDFFTILDYLGIR